MEEDGFKWKGTGLNGRGYVKMKLMGLNGRGWV